MASDRGDAITAELVHATPRTVKLDDDPIDLEDRPAETLIPVYGVCAPIVSKDPSSRTTGLTIVVSVSL